MGESNRKTICVACPISNREWILPYYLEHVYNLEYPKELISLYWIINNSKDNSEQLLKQFKHEHEHEYKSIKLDYYYKNASSPPDSRDSKTRLSYTYIHLSNMRNMILDYSSKINSTLFSCDSDILIPKDILYRLLNSDKKIISSLIYNGYLKNSTAPYKYPNILNFNSKEKKFEHISNWYVKNASNLTEEKLVKVDYTGAVYLIDNDVVSNKNVRYAMHPQGEDTSFCISAQKENYELWCYLNVFSYHIMSPHYLELYLKDKELLQKGI